MPKIKSLVLATSLAAAAGGSSAALDTTDLQRVSGCVVCDGGANFSFNGRHDLALGVPLDRGDYLFTLKSLVANDPTKANFEAAWVSLGLNRKTEDANDFGAFSLSAPEEFGQVLVHVSKDQEVVYLDVRGNNLAKGYSGTLNVTSVPEPHTGAMVLAGLGLLGAVVRRRKLHG